MTTPARHEEADAAAVAFQLALTQIGVESVQEALTLWQDVPVGAQPATAARWLEQALAMVLRYRARSRALAMAYFRLARALRTGETIEDPLRPDPPYVRLSDLRREFALLAATEQTTDRTSIPVVVGSEDEDEDQVSDDLVAVVVIASLGDDLAAVEADAEEETLAVLENLGPRLEANRLRKIDGGRPADEVDALRAEAHESAGNRQAAAVSRIGMNGARSTMHTTSARDNAVIGWVRLSRTGTPCGWCAMLISRGPILKGSKRRASIYQSSRMAGGTRAEQDAGTVEADMYHDRCKCYAEPIYSVSQYGNQPLYELNRLYAKWWPIVTDGLSGDAALTAWRAWIRKQAQDAPQEAA